MLVPCLSGAHPRVRRIDAPVHRAYPDVADGYAATPRTPSAALPREPRSSGERRGRVNPTVGRVARRLMPSLGRLPPTAPMCPREGRTRPARSSAVLSVGERCDCDVRSRSFRPRASRTSAVCSPCTRPGTAKEFVSAADLAVRSRQLVGRLDGHLCARVTGLAVLAQADVGCHLIRLCAHSARGWQPKC